MNTVAGLTDFALKASGEDKAPYYLNPNNFNSTIGFGDSNCVLNIVRIFATRIQARRTMKNNVYQKDTPSHLQSNMWDR